MLHNIIILFDLLFDTSTLRASKRGLGYKHWFQNHMGNSMITYGVRLAEDAWVNYNANIVNNFMRRLKSLRILQFLRREQDTSRRDQRSRRVTRRVLGDCNNVRRSRGRPKKRKRGGGRRKSSDSSTAPRRAPVLSAAARERIQTLAFVDKTPPFVPKRRGPKSKGKKTSESMKVGGLIHRRVPTAALQSGPQSRRGRPVSLRGRCVCCYANAPQPI